MKVIDLKQGSPEWINWRSKGIGSTDISAIMGENRYKSAYDVALEKMGVSDPIFENEHIRRGKYYEAEAQEWIRNHLDILSFSAPCIEHSEFPFFHSSLDFYAKDKNIIAEIKIPSEKNFQSRTLIEEIELYSHQLQWHMLCSGMGVIYFFRYHPEEEKMEFTTVDRNDDLIKEMMVEAIKFWNNLQEGILPEKENESYERLLAPEALSLTDQYVLLIHEKKEIEARLKTLKEYVLKYSNGGNFILNESLKCTLTKGRISYDFEAMKNDGIDLSKYEKEGKEHYTIKTT